MEKKNSGYKIITIIALVFAVASLSMAYAGYTARLKIAGTNASVSSNWRIVWKDLSTNAKITGSATTVGATLSIEKFSKQSISGNIGTLTAPGDSIEYSWVVANEGDINAKLSAIALGNLTCLPETIDGGVTIEQANELCKHLEISFTYDGVEVPKYGIDGLTTSLPKSGIRGSLIPVTMKLTYLNEAPAVGISGNVNVNLSTTTFTYIQDDK